MSGPGHESGGRATAVVALMSASLLALELVWTRIFSAEFFYTFAFLVLSLAILGMGLGALALRLLPFLDRNHLLGPFLSLAGLATILGPLLIFRLGLDFATVFGSVAMLSRFVAAVALLSSTFFFGGLALAMLFKRNHARMPLLYMADLLGAAAGLLGIVWLMNHLGTPVATFLGVLPILGAALLASKGWLRAVPVALAVVAVLLCPSAAGLLEADREERAPVVYKHWDAMAKIKMYDFGGRYRGLNADNVANSPVYPFDGNFDDPELEEAEWGIDVSNLIQRFDSPTFLSLGAGGGTDVFQALVEGATEVHAVEVNPHVNEMMLHGDPSGYIEPEVTDEPATTAAAEEEERDGSPPAPVLRNEAGEIITLAEFSGHLYDDPRVRVVSEDARTYVRRHENSFDVIYSLSSNTWAALGSGSFALAENYIFTVEAYQDYWRALTDDGFLSMEHQVYMPRLVSAALQALEQLGVDDPAAHLAVYDLPQMHRNLMLLSKRPLTDEIRNNAYGELTPEKYERIHLLYPAPAEIEDNLINRIVTEGWEQVADSAPLNVSPSTDDRPFVAQMGLWRNFKWEGLRKMSQWEDFQGFPLSKSIIVGIMLVVVLLVLPLNLLPFLRRGEDFAAGCWLYFFTIGIAFMSVEVVLIQKYTLFIGASVYSIATVLLTLLLASGVGSRFSRGVGDRAAFAGIIVLLLLHALAFGALTRSLSGLPQFSRSLITALLVAPLGFFMGMPFPKGSLRVGERIDWGFAVNGAASVLGATAILLLSFTFGFRVALLAAAAVYLLAYGFLRGVTSIAPAGRTGHCR
jgi:hypothetical protein